MAASKPDVSEMFEKMGEKLGWFKHKDLDTALKALSSPTKKKPSRLRLKKNSSSAKSCGRNEDRTGDIKVPDGSQKDSSGNSNSSEGGTFNTKGDLLKALSFKGMLSSDSDSSDYEIKSAMKKGSKPKAILQVASDSENETSVAMEDTYVSCIGESPLQSNRPSLIPPVCDKSQEEKLTSKNDYEETILKSRVSMSTFSLDLDYIGDPLVESTRIHRRSSVTYRQFISPDTSDESIRVMKSAETSPLLQKQDQQSNNIIENNNLICSNFDNLTLSKISKENDDNELSELSHINETKYMTAIENFKGLEDEHFGKHEGAQNGGGHKETATDKCKKTDVSVVAEEHVSLNASEEEEVIEVVDIAIQTDEIIEESECDAKAHLSAYDQETVCDIYDQETVRKEVSKIDLSSTDTSLELSAYEQSTVHRVKQTRKFYRNQTQAESSPECNPNYSNLTDIKSSGSPYEQTSLRMETEDKNSDTSIVSVNSSGKSLVDSTASDESLIEVRDIGTQTENGVESQNLTVTEEQSDHVIEECNSDKLTDNEADNRNDSDHLNGHDEELEEDKNIIEQSDESVSDDEEKGTERGEAVEQDTKPENTKKSSGNFSLLSSDSNDGELDFSKLRKKAESGDPSSPSLNSGRRESQKSDTANQSWRTTRQDSSESSDDDGKLEAFFQKLRKPEKEKSDSDHSRGDQSMDDFIVEDDDMTSESDDSAFYMRETQKLEEASLAERLRRNKGSLVNQISSQASDEEGDEVFSSKLYPDSVTKHKKKTISKSKETPRSWSFSSDSSDSCDSPPREKPETSTHNMKNQKSAKQKTTTGNVTKKMTFDTSSSGSDSNDEGPTLFKTPNPLRKTKRPVSKAGKENKIKPADFDEEDNRKGNKWKTTKSTPSTGYISLSDEDSEDDSLPSFGSVSSSTDISSTNVSGQDDNVFYKLPTPVSKRRQPQVTTPLSTRGGCTYSFLKSLSNVVEDESRRHPEASKFVKGFKKAKEELMHHLFSLYNRTIFEGKLPSDLPLIWNKRLLRTAGYCAYKRHRGNQDDRTARVELSTKVCDSAERVRDTLVHELCHAAVWLLNGVNGGHGAFWKYWARQANRMHPELPAIGRCHSYSINTKFTYKCTRCGYSIGRHSKSLNTEKKVCGYCHGTFELIQNATPTTPMSAARSASSSLSSAPATPRTPNKFALFVKENYNTVKQKDKSLKHGDVMKELSKLFAESKITS